MFKVVMPGFEQVFERWTEALEQANALRPSLKSWFKDIRILERISEGSEEGSKPRWRLVWVYGRGRSHPEYIGPGTYDRLARQFIQEEQAAAKTARCWQIRNHRFEWGARTYLMGVLNVTPDSFSDGGEFDTIAAALNQAQKLAADVDMLDIGGQSTRPGAAQISAQTECERVLPIIKAIRGSDDTQLREIPISIDTTRCDVARAALTAGADIINDVSAGTYEPQIFTVAAEFQAPIMLMHLRGTPATMQQMTDYDDLMGEIIQFLAAQSDQAVAAGVDPTKIVVDPGIGFAKTVEQNLTILRELEKMRVLNCPILVGTSRKSFIGKLLNQPETKNRGWGTAATLSCAIAHGADLVRVHDGREMRDVCRMADFLWRSS